MKKITILLFAICVISFSTKAQPLYQFEQLKPTAEFDGVKMTVGGDFALQLQSLSHHAADTLIKVGTGFNLPTANLSLTGFLAKGVKVYLNTYLSARHHNESWVEGGYVQFDELPFLKFKFVDKVMKNLQIKVGMMEINYGDAHFRRTNNGAALKNYFVGNMIMEGYTTSPAMEFLFRKSGFIGLLGVSNGSLNTTLGQYQPANTTPRTYKPINQLDELAVYGKLGYDKEFNDDFRLRGTVSYYYCAQNHTGSLYAGDRTGSRYYLVMNKATYASGDYTITANPFGQDWNPGGTDKDNSMMINLFGKYKGFELFGTYEQATTTSPSDTKPSLAIPKAKSEIKFSQIAVEGLFHFGKEKQFFVGGRYNTVSDNSGGTDTYLNGSGGNVDLAKNKSVNRIQGILGWYLTKNMVAKVEYVKQDYNNFLRYDVLKTKKAAGFDGIMFEAAISF
ncbi:MAG: hypothetical protein WCP69_08515 [Bacteroidota bacterium]